MLSLSDFKRHFKNNYEKAIDKHHTDLKRSRFFNPLIPFGVTMIVMLTWTFLPSDILSSAFPWISTIAFPWLIMICMILIVPFMLIYGRLRRLRGNLRTKDILAYYLLKASECFEAYETEVSGGNMDASQKFLSDSLRYIRRFSDSLKEMIEESTISLNLPNIAQLDNLSENVIDRIYPLIREGRNTNDILLSLSRFFFYEKEYNQLHLINSELEGTLSPGPFEGKRGLEEFLGNLVRTNFFLASFLLLVIVAASALAGVCLLRYPTLRFEGYWDYVSTKSAEIIMGILAAWAALLYILHTRYRSAES